MIELKRSRRVGDGLAMVVGIMVGSGIFRTPGGMAQPVVVISVGVMIRAYFLGYWSTDR